MKHLLALALLVVTAQSNAESLSLKVARIEEHPASANYYIELLERSLLLAGYQPTIEVVTVPQARAVAYLNSGKIDLLWLLETPERDSLYQGVDFPLTSGLIGSRLLLIRPEDQQLFSNIDSLESLRELNLVAAFGSNWFDAKIWSHNNLTHVEHMGNWNSIYPMLANQRVYDYFPRGAVEITSESEAFPYLAIEQSLVLKYDADFKFYLSEPGSRHANSLKKALDLAKEHGLFDEVFNKYWSQDLLPLNLETRKVIELSLPG